MRSGAGVGILSRKLPGAENKGISAGFWTIDSMQIRGSSMLQSDLCKGLSLQRDPAVTDVKRSLVCLIVACVSLSAIIGTVVLRSMVYNPAEWHLALILLIMFLGGVVMTCSEVAKWWEARMMQRRQPPFANLITYTRDSDRYRLATHMLGFPLSRLHAIPDRLHPPVEIVEQDQPKKAA